MLNTQNYNIKCAFIYGEHVQCVNNHNTKFEYKGMKTAWVTDNTKAFRMEKMSKFNSPKNMKMLIKFAQKGEAHVQCINNHYAKFEY